MQKCVSQTEERFTKGSIKKKVQWRISRTEIKVAAMAALSVEVGDGKE